MLLKSFTALWLAQGGNGSKDRLRPQLNPLRLHAIGERPCDAALSGDGDVCREDGLWRPQQCSGGECWCVNALNGQPDHTSKTKNIHEQNCGTSCLGGQWTRWFNTDHPLTPTGELRKGDLETLDRAKLDSRRVCELPLGFKIAVDDGTNGQGLPVEQFNDNLHITYEGPTMGLRCYNGEQATKCKDYKIKFCCALNQMCHWSSWDEWSECSRTCGTKGVRHRARQVLYKPKDMDECPGRDYEVEECGTDSCCARDCTWSDWTNWSECSKGCHGGVTKRSRQIETKSECGGECPGRPEQVEQCHPDCGIYGVWNGNGCECDLGWFGQCCRKQDTAAGDIQADDSGFDLGRLGSQRSGPGFPSSLISDKLSDNQQQPTTDNAADNEKCQKLMSRTPPQNGKLDCQRHRQTPTIACEVSCDRGFDFLERPAHKYFCHPTGITFTSPPGKSLDWPDCTRRHEKRGIKNEVWFEYELSDDHVNCKDNLHELKRRFRTADEPWLSSSYIPGFSYFTRIRLRCGNRQEVLKVSKNNELEEIFVTAETGNSVSSPWARNKQLTATGLDGMGLDRIGNFLQQENVRSDTQHFERELWDKEELRAMKREKIRSRKKEKREKRRKDKKKRERRDTENNLVFVQLRLIQFPTEHMTHAGNMSALAKATLIRHLKESVGGDELNLERHGKVLGRLRRVDMLRYPMEQTRCLNGEVQRLSADEDEICVACPSGTYQLHNECRACPIGSYQPKSGQIECRQCHQSKTTPSTGSQRAKECV